MDYVLRQHKQWRFSTEGRNYRKQYWFRTWFFRKMQHSFFTNFTQTDAWRQIQLRICILFFQASIRNCKNCVYNEDHSLFDFHIRDSIYNIIHISFYHLSTPNGLTRAHKWPTSNVNWLKLRTGAGRSRAQTPLKSYSHLRRSHPFLPDFWSIIHFEQNARIVKQFTAYFGRFYSTTRLSVAPYNKVLFYKSSTNQGVRIWLTVTSPCKVWTVVIRTPLHRLLSWRFCTQLSNMKVCWLATVRCASL